MDKKNWHRMVRILAKFRIPRDLAGKNKAGIGDVLWMMILWVMMILRVMMI
jgi:hypothetical protein